MEPRVIVVTRVAAEASGAYVRDMLSLPGVHCSRRGGKLIIEIPEDAVVALVEKPHGREPRMDVVDRNALLDDIARFLPEVDDGGRRDYDEDEQELRSLVRRAAYRAEAEERGAFFDQSMVD